MSLETLQAINNMGVEKMSDIESKALDRFIDSNSELLENMSRMEIYELYKNSTHFTSIRLGVAFSGLGIAIKDSILKKGLKDV